MQQVLADRCDRHLGQHELGPADGLGTGIAKHLARKSLESRLEPPGVRGHPLAQGLRPFTLNEVVAVIKQQQPAFIDMFAHPSRRVQRHVEPVAGFASGLGAVLERQHGLQPQLPEQRVARRKAMIKGSRRGLQKLGDRADRHGRRATFRREGKGGV